jgi:hypothetical protein
MNAKYLQTFAAIGVALLAIAATTVLEGQRTERWRQIGDPKELELMAARLEDIPLEFDLWEGSKQKDTEELLVQYKEARVAGHINLTYVHKRTGNRVSVSLVCGHSRNVSIHTPDQCYVGAGYKMVETTPQARDVITDLGPEPIPFQSAQFVKEMSSPPIHQRIMWSWCDGGNWVATGGADRARFDLAWRGNMYKLYVTTSVRSTQNQKDIDESVDFIRKFLPAIQSKLYPPEAAEASADEEPPSA